MTSTQIDNYIFNNLPSYDGWMPLLRELLTTLLNKGWDETIIFTAKEKYGKFVYVIADEKFSTFISTFNEFEEKINQSCMICGDNGKQCTPGYSDQTLCLTHYIDAYPKIVNIDQFGFTTKEERFNWSDILELNGFADYRGHVEFSKKSEMLSSIYIELKPNFSSQYLKEIALVSLHHDDLNWINFLKNIPSEYLKKKQDLNNYIKELLKSFYFCDICGFKAISNYEFHKCSICHKYSWESMTERYTRRYENKTDYIKQNQLMYFSGGFNYELNKLEISFEKKPSFRRMFSNQEFKEYLDLIKS